DTVFVLQAYKVITVEVEKLVGPFIGSPVFLVKFQPYLFGVLITRIGVIHRNRKQALRPIFCGYCAAEVGRKGRDSAASRKIVSDKSHSCRQRQPSIAQRWGRMRRVRGFG